MLFFLPNLKSEKTAGTAGITETNRDLDHLLLFGCTKCSKTQQLKQPREWLE